MTDTFDQQHKDRFYKWGMLILLAVTYFLMHSTRQVFNACLPQIKASFAGSGVTDAQLGLSRTIFLFAYGLMVPFAGLAADFLHRKWVIVLGALFFSTSCLFTGFADSMLVFFILYGILNGVGQCMIPGPASSLIAQFHIETRSTALSIYQSALYVAVVTASVAGGWLGGLSQDGWRLGFWIFGGAAAVWTLVVAFFLRNTPPLLHAGLKEHHHLHHHDDTAKPSFSDAIRAFFSKPSALLLTFAFGMLVFGSNCFRTWMPAYMQKAGWGLSTGQAAFHAVFWFYIGSFLGIGTGARLSDRLSRIRPGIRLVVMSAGLALAAPTMALMVNMPTLWLSCVMMFFFGLGNGFFDCNLYAGLYDVVAPRYRSASMGMYLCGAFLIGCPATAVLGWVGQHYSLSFGMAIFGGTYGLGALAIFLAWFFFYKRDRVEE